MIAGFCRSVPCNVSGCVTTCSDYINFCGRFALYRDDELLGVLTS